MDNKLPRENSIPLVLIDRSEDEPVSHMVALSSRILYFYSVFIARFDISMSSKPYLWAEILN